MPGERELNRLEISDDEKCSENECANQGVVKLDYCKMKCLELIRRNQNGTHANRCNNLHKTCKLVQARRYILLFRLWTRECNQDDSRVREYHQYDVTPLDAYPKKQM